MRDDSRFNASQRKALTAEGNVLVSASAGSGKTTVLIEKLLGIIARGGDIRRLAVMTFSRAAAAEMKNRLLRGLYETVRSGSTPDAHVLKQLEAFPFANICTIDGFCYNLVKKYFAVIGADPSLRPLDPDESELLKDACIEQACEELFEKREESFLAYAEKYTRNRRLDEVKKQIKDLREFLKVQPDPEGFLATDFKSAQTDYFFRFISELSEPPLKACEIAANALDLTESGNAEIKELAHIMYDGLKRLSEYAEKKDADGFFYAYSFLVKGSAKKGKLSPQNEVYFNDAVSKYNDFLDRLKGFADAYRYDGNEADKEALIGVTVRVEELYTEMKKREGGMDFADMGAMALKILDNPDIAKEIRESYDYIFVDEYQDTNYLQEKLLRLISNGDNAFTVGDVKQAIYHFRYAEPEIFRARMCDYEPGVKGQNVYLNENYRSRYEILDFVNAYCSEVMTEDFCGIDYRGLNVMNAGAEYKDTTEAVEIYLCGKQGKKAVNETVYSVKEANTDDEDEREAYFVADYIRRRVDEGLLLYRPKRGRFEKLTYGDVAVLCRKKSGCRKIGKALSKFGIAYSIADADENVFAPRELLVDVLRLLISNPDGALVNVLMSLIGNFTAAELMEIRAKAPKTRLWEALITYSGNTELEEKIRGFLGYIDELKKMSVTLNVSDILIKVLGDGADGYFSTLGADVCERVYKFIEAVKRMECNSDIRAFLQYYEEAYKGEKPSSGRDSVSVMTLHKSKGLEFPLVIIPFIDESATGGGKGSALYTDKELGIALKYVDEEVGTSKDSFATKILKEKSNLEERQELARLTYVGFTRAENKLVITGKTLCGSKKDIVKKPRDASSIADLIYYAATRNPKLFELVREIEVTAQPVAKERSVDRAESLNLEYLYEGYAYAESVKLANKYSVSEISERETGVASPFNQSGRQSSKKEGTAYHLIMQRIDLNADRARIEACIREHAESGEIEEEVAKKLDAELIFKLLSSDVMALARRARIYREQPFVYKKDEGEDSVLIQGVIDLIIEEDDGLTVVDYKASGKSREILAKTYLRQLEIYSEAASKIWKKPIKSRILFNILQNYEVYV